MFRRNRVPLYTSKGCSRDEENDLTKMYKECKFPEPLPVTRVAATGPRRKGADAMLCTKSHPLQHPKAVQRKHLQAVQRLHRWTFQRNLMPVATPL
ncbi:hypothetical protein niasHT_009925 [Heterodera trifolii]|uniref:Uncharacterized protein n=1 Tax=Heterodera trifolii TaxID=157864 RepID=A0ABD2MD98_9BILA